MKLLRLPKLYWTDLKLVGIVAWIVWLGFTARFRRIWLLPAPKRRKLN